MDRLLPWLNDKRVIPIRPAAWLILLACLGCQPTPQSAQVAESKVEKLGSHFDAARTGTLQGTVQWDGPLPDAPPLIVNVPGLPRRTERNPNQPRIDAASRGIAGAVVYLKEIDLTRSRPWDHPPVRVGSKQGAIHVHQGPSETAVGFVQKGAIVEWMHHDEAFFSLRARGAAFFSLPFVHPKPTLRSLNEAGHVELSSGSGQFWMRGHLFVSPHPYLCRTDAEGRFALPQVPAGTYELHCWLPHWKIERLEYDAEQRHLVRLYFAEAWRSKRDVQVSPSGTTTVSFSLGDTQTPSK